MRTESQAGGGDVSNTSPDAPYWSSPVSDLLNALDTTSAGLSSAEARARLRRSGVLEAHHHRTEMVLMLRQFANPITLILVVATLISAALGEAADAAVILAIVLLSGLLSFWQEFRASRAVEELLASIQVTVEVWRDGARSFVPAPQIVPGDMVVLDTGDLIPGDCRLVEADELLVDEAPLTGESYPVEKAPGVLHGEMTVNRRTNCLFLGTHVVRGSATAVVVRTGELTEFGRIAKELGQRPPTTRFERGLAEFGGLLLRVMVVLVVAIFITNVVLARPIVDSFLFSVALAVGLTPQLLPAIVSVSLSLGARRMARAKVIVKRLSAIEDFGGIDVICTDKTGTLTLGSVRLVGAVDIHGRPSSRVLDYAHLNAIYHTGFANPIDDAILGAAAAVTTPTERLGELPYDFQRKRLSVLVRRDGAMTLVTKGAVTNVLEVCDEVELPDGTTAPLADHAAAISERFEVLSGRGYRVLGVARKVMDESRTLRPSDECAMAFAGFLSFRDPPKPDSARTLRELAALGISLRMVTGDNRLAAAHIGRVVGLSTDRVLTGEDLDRLSDEALAREARGVEIFAETDPMQKERLVKALRSGGHVVGFLGDGINDAPALHAADVGISVETAVDIAKDSASIVLLEKDLGVLVQGVRLGRQTFANTTKYVFVTTSANFGNMASMAAATAFLPFLPLLPLQILLLNFLSDLPAMTIAADAVDSEQLQRPGVWDIHFIRDFMVGFGLVSSVFDFLTFGALRLGFSAQAEIFRSGWFLESVATELVVMLVLRTRRPFFQSRPGTALLASSIVVAIVTLAVPFSPLAGPLGFVALPWPVLLTLAAITIGYVMATELAKARFYRRLAAREPTD